MSYSIILFSNLIFRFVDKILNNFSSCEILSFQIVELDFFIFQIVKFYKIVNHRKLFHCYILLVNYLVNCLIFQLEIFGIS